MAGLERVAAESEAAMSKPLHVLIVEDSESDAAMVVHLLRKAGYDVHDQRVESAGQMQAALEKQAWDVVISDYHLPQFNGPAALALIQEACLDIPFIVVSGIIDEETAIAMMRAGANDYLMKGKLNHLAAAVERELRDAKVRWGRKQADEALRQSEERFRTLVENIPGEVYRCLPTPPWRLIHNSAKIETITGYPVSDFLEGSLFYSDFILPEDLEMVHSAMEAGIACKEPFIIEYRLRHADGSIHWVSERGRAVYSEQGEPLWLDGVIMDITARKQAEEAKLRLGAAVEQAIEGIAVADMDGVIQVVNSAWAQMHGYMLDEVLG
ncbi:MAG: PAS domain S-box protein, partial [Anaerolineales bacterium]|nr:PAS domain S-box protein [Anaerolineales bacterium]